MEFHRLFRRRSDLADLPIGLSLLAPSEAFQFLRRQMHFFWRWRFVKFIELQPVLSRDGIKHAKLVDRIRLFVAEAEADQVYLGARTVERYRHAGMNPQLAALVQKHLLLVGNTGVGTQIVPTERMSGGMDVLDDRVDLVPLRIPILIRISDREMVPWDRRQPAVACLCKHRILIALRLDRFQEKLQQLRGGG